MNTKANSGFTLVEVLVAMVFFLICSIGLVSFTIMSLGERKTIERRQEAYAMALDIAERLRFISAGNEIVRPKAANANKYLRYNKDTGNLEDCSSGNEIATETFANPIGSNALYIYDVDHNGVLSSTEIYEAANAEVDHPNTSVASYDSVNPIRKTSNGTTFYGIWSVRYFPCNYSDQAKIIVTVYWIEPEPKDVSVANVLDGINNGVYRLKRLTITTDRAYKVAR
jgi:prepilin-type N-terminal cleavage/methylation domain-containing protein